MLWSKLIWADSQMSCGICRTTGAGNVSEPPTAAPAARVGGAGANPGLNVLSRGTRRLPCVGYRCSTRVTVLVF